MQVSARPIKAHGPKILWNSTASDRGRLIRRCRASKDFEDFILSTQSQIIEATEALDGKGVSFHQDRWSRGDKNAGYGITAVLEGGDIVEKAAVNISIIHGTLTAQRALAMSSRGRNTVDPGGGQSYHAAAMSLVFHSAKPFIPTLRADVRLFSIDNGPAWYGGGCDLTPFYLIEEDAIHFHEHWCNVCDTHHPSLYRKYKEWCDNYFYIPARKEYRGIGGIFFDDVDSAEAAFDPDTFVKDVAINIVPSWEDIVNKRRDVPYGEQQREWQLLRRGRYLEFNLLYDRGVKFGLDGGRVESIMVSAPPLIAWKYNVVPQEGSEEEKLLHLLSSAPRNWLD